MKCAVYWLVSYLGRDLKPKLQTLLLSFRFRVSASMAPRVLIVLGMLLLVSLVKVHAYICLCHLSYIIYQSINKSIVPKQRVILFTSIFFFCSSFGGWFAMQVSSDPKIEQEIVEEKELLLPNEPVCF